MSRVQFFAKVIGEVKGRCIASRTEHSVVDGLYHPADFLCEGQVGIWSKGTIGEIKGSCVNSRIVYVKASHVVGSIFLDEQAPVGGCRASTVRPGEGRHAVSDESVGCRIPHQLTLRRSGVDSADCGCSNRSILPCECEVGPLAGAAFSRCERDQVVGIARGVNHQ